MICFLNRSFPTNLLSLTSAFLVREREGGSCFRKSLSSIFRICYKVSLSFGSIKKQTTGRRKNTYEGRRWWRRRQWDEEVQKPFSPGPIFSDAKWKWRVWFFHLQPLHQCCLSTTPTPFLLLAVAVAVDINKKMTLLLLLETLMMPLLLSITCFIGNPCLVLSNSPNYCLQLSKWDSITMLWFLFPNKWN